VISLATLPTHLQRAQRLFQDQRMRSIVIMVLLCIDALVAVVEIFFRGTSSIDIATYYRAALALRAGQDPLRAAVSYVAQYHVGMPLRGDLYLYPPAFALLFVPLTFLPFSTAVIVWTACGLAFVALAVYAMFRVLRQYPSFLVLTIVTSLVFWAFPVRTGISLGQPTPLVLCGLACALWARQEHRPVLGGIILGLAATPKPELLVLAAVWLWKRELRFAISTVLSFLVMLVAPVPPWLGLRTLTEQLQLWRFWNDSYLPQLLNLSFKGLPVRLFTPNPVVAPVTNAPLLVTILWLLLVVIVVLLTACRVRQRPLDSTPLCLLEVGLALSAMLLISPLTEDHYLTLLAVTFVALTAVALDQGNGAKQRRTAFFAAVGVWVLWSLPLNTPQGLVYGMMLRHPTFAGVLTVIQPLFLYEVIAIFAILLWAVGRLSGQSWRSAVRATLADLTDLLPSSVLSMPTRRVTRRQGFGSDSVDKKRLVSPFFWTVPAYRFGPRKKGAETNLVAFSIRTKGVSNFARRLWTVFARFGFSDARSRRTLLAILATVRKYGGHPTFFIPAVVLRRHPELINEIALCGAEIGTHGYVHNDYRALSKASQHYQTQQALAVFQEVQLPCQGFRNPYLGWTEEAVSTFAELGFGYDSNEAVIHDVVKVERLTSALRAGYLKSLSLFQAIAPSAYTLRPHFEGELVRIPTSIPDDEMLYDRLRITEQEVLGDLWCEVMNRVYSLGGIYTLNLHPERGVLCKPALQRLLAYSQHQTLPVWLASLREIEVWWRERREFRFSIEPCDDFCWRVQATCTPRATILSRCLNTDTGITPWSGVDAVIPTHQFMVRAEKSPIIGLSHQTPRDVEIFLLEQGYPLERAELEASSGYAFFLDMPDGLGLTRPEQVKSRTALVAEIEALERPLIRFGIWPECARAALAITGDIDSITVQDFFLRILEVRRHV
jgi:peptidoglycan/xylan/chitin deacetylase (PgdA/CDA1 family)